MDSTPVSPIHAFGRAARCTPVLFAFSSGFFLLAAAVTLPAFFSWAAFAIAAAGFVASGTGAYKDARAGRRYKVPYSRQAKTNWALSGLLTANVLYTSAERLQPSALPMIQNLVELAADKPLLQNCILAVCYAVWASANSKEVKRKECEEAGLPPPKKLDLPTTRWSIGDTISNALSLPGVVVGFIALGLSLNREPPQDKIDVRNWKDFAAKHITPMRTLATSYLFTAAALFPVHPIYTIGYVIGTLGSACYDGEDRTLNRDFVPDLEKACARTNWFKAGRMAAALAVSALALSGSAQQNVSIARIAAVQPQ